MTPGNNEVGDTWHGRVQLHLATSLLKTRGKGVHLHIKKIFDNENAKQRKCKMNRRIDKQGDAYTETNKQMLRLDMRY